MQSVTLNSGSYQQRGYRGGAKSPVALSATIAVHVGLAAAVLLIPNKIITFIDPPLETTNIPIDSDPPPLPPPPQEEVIKRQHTDAPKSVVDTGVDTGFILPPIDPTTGGATGTGTVIKELPPPPPEPVMTAARPDPRYAASFQPEYPPAMIRRGVEGFVKLRLFIDERGRVSAAELVEATDPAFWEAARKQALKLWRFSPALRDGGAVSSSQVMTVRFRLSDLG